MNHFKVKTKNKENEKKQRYFVMQFECQSISFGYTRSKHIKFNFLNVSTPILYAAQEENLIYDFFVPLFVHRTIWNRQMQTESKKKKNNHKIHRKKGQKKYPWRIQYTAIHSAQIYNKITTIVPKPTQFSKTKRENKTENAIACHSI